MSPGTSKRTQKYEKLARIYDDEILPVWSQRFGRMMLRGLEVPPKAMVLDVACGTGYPSLEILRRMDEQSRLIAIDSSSFLLDVARQKAGELAGKRVFFRTESALPRLSFADDVYDLVLCNLGLSELGAPQPALRDFARVTKPGGQVITTVTLAGTFAEFHDIYREVLLKHDKHEMLARLDAYVQTYPEPEQAEGWLRTAGLTDVSLEIEEFSLLFRSSREFFFAPVIEYGPLPRWKEIAGKGQELQDVFWYIKQAIDAYFEGRAFEVTVKAGCLRGTKVAAAAAAAAAAESVPRLTSEPPNAAPAADAAGESAIPLTTGEFELAEVNRPVDDIPVEEEEELEAFQGEPLGERRPTTTPAIREKMSPPDDGSSSGT